MKKKISLSTAITLILLTAALAISLTMVLAIRYFNRQVQSVAQRQAMYTHINDVDKKVREYYTDIDDEMLRQKLTEGYVDGIGDSYAAYFTATEYTAEQNRLAGKATDIGLTVCAADGKIAVSAVNINSPADQSGVKKGDVLTAVNGEDVGDKTVLQIQRIIDTSEKVLLSVTREKKSLAFELSPSPYTLRSVQSELMDGIAYIRISAFLDNTPEQFRAVVSDMQQQGVNGFIFDLRGNAGGSRAAAEEVISFLVPLGQYGTETDKNGKIQRLMSDGSNAISLSTVTLVDSATMGEAEFFAGVLKELSMTTVIGETTAGKAKYQSLFPLETDGSAIKLTVGSYGLVKGGSWEGVGIEPDTAVVLTDAQKELSALTALGDDLMVKVALRQLPNNTAASEEPDIDAAGATKAPPATTTAKAPATTTAKVTTTAAKATPTTTAKAAKAATKTTKKK